MCITAPPLITPTVNAMVDHSTHSITTLIPTHDPYGSTVAINTFPDKPNSLASQVEKGVSELFPDHNRLRALTPVNASSLFWLI